MQNYLIVALVSANYLWGHVTLLSLIPATVYICTVILNSNISNRSNRSSFSNYHALQAEKALLFRIIKTRGDWNSRIEDWALERRDFYGPSPLDLQQQADARRCRGLRRRGGAPDRRRREPAGGARGDGGAERRRCRGGRGGRDGSRGLSRLRWGWRRRGRPERDAPSGCSGGHDGRGGRVDRRRRRAIRRWGRTGTLMIGRSTTWACGPREGWW
jgi:hypothetical protein